MDQFMKRQSGRWILRQPLQGSRAALSRSAVAASRDLVHEQGVRHCASGNRSAAAVGVKANQYFEDRCEEWGEKQWAWRVLELTSVVRKIRLENGCGRS